MSSQELTIRDAPIEFKFKKADNLEGILTIDVYIGLDQPRGRATIDRAQLHLLMLYLQEHLEMTDKCGHINPNQSLEDIKKEVWNKAIEAAQTKILKFYAPQVLIELLEGLKHGDE